MGTNLGGRRVADDTRSVLDSLRRLVQGLRVAARAAESELGLSGAQLFVLQKLGEETAMSVNDLAERTCTHQSSVSVVVQRLVEKGLVRREASAADRRRVELSLTPTGRKLINRSPTAAQDQVITALEAMSPAGRKQLSLRLAELIEQMGLSEEPPAMLFEDTGREKRAGGGGRGGSRKAKPDGRTTEG
jgi:DNA-binding MarR family transcriptional regulator